MLSLEYKNPLDQIMYVDTLLSRRWNIAPTFLQYWLCMTSFQRVQYGKVGG